MARQKMEWASNVVITRHHLVRGKQAVKVLHSLYYKPGKKISDKRICAALVWVESLTDDIAKALVLK